MKKKKKERPALPKIRRHRWRDAGWLAMEPAKLGLVVACIAAGLALLFCYLRQLAGAPMTITDVCIGVAKTFVVSYAVSGLFVLYLLWVAEKELTPPAEPKKKASLKSGKDEKAAAAEPTLDALDVMTEALERLEGGEYEPKNTEES